MASPAARREPDVADDLAMERLGAGARDADEVLRPAARADGQDRPAADLELLEERRREGVAVDIHDGDA
jgi:hypothetical protein